MRAGLGCKATVKDINIAGSAWNAFRLGKRTMDRPFQYGEREGMGMAAALVTESRQN